METKEDRKGKIGEIIISRFPHLIMKDISYDDNKFCVNAILIDTINNKEINIIADADSFQELCQKITLNQLKHKI